MRLETIKLPEDNIGNKLRDAGLDNDFLNLIPKTKVNKWDYIKLESFCTAKKTTNKMKKQGLPWWSSG